LLTLSRQAISARTPIARISLAVILTLVMLAGVAPFSSLSSSHECGMACCAGKPSHMAGSCSTAFDAEESAETDDESGQEHSAHSHQTHSSGATPKTTISGKHRVAAKSSSTHHSTHSKASTLASSIASQAVTTPCSPECAVAASVSAQVRRPREQSALSSAFKLRSSTTRSLNERRAVLPSKSAEAARPSQPRAPPTLLTNLPA
jgi:hypothetical protein